MVLPRAAPAFCAGISGQPTGISELLSATTEQVQAEGGQQITASRAWLELTQALVCQLFCLADDASHTSAIEQVLAIAHLTKHEEDIIDLLRMLSSSNLVSDGARTLGRQLLDYLEADLASQEFLVAAHTLIERVSRAYTGSARLLARIYGKRGMAYVSRGELKPAIEDLDRALALDPDYAAALLLRGIAWSALGEERRAIADLNHALALDGNNTLAYVHRGIAYRKLKDDERAMEDFDYALGLDPHLDEVSLLRSLTYGRFNERRRGLETFDHALERNPNDAQTLIVRGMAHCALGEYERAIKDLDRALALNPHDALAAAGRGHVYLEMGDIGLARDDFRRSRALDPGDVYTGLLLEWTALCQDGPQPGTAARLEAIATENPYEYAAYVCRGVALLLQERFEEALAQLGQALLLDARKGHAYVWKSLACAFLGQDEEAEAALAQAKTAELPLSEVLFAPLRWLEQKRVDFYQQHVVPLLETLER